MNTMHYCELVIHTVRNADDLSAGLFKVQELNNSLVHTFNHPLSILSNKFSLICLSYIQGWTTANSSIRS